MEKYLTRKKDKYKYLVWVKELNDSLLTLYKNRSLADNYVIKQKKLIFGKALKNIPKFESYDFISGRFWNNASIAIVKTYGLDFSKFERAFFCIGEELDDGQRINRFIKLFKKLMLEYSNGDEILLALCLE